MSHEALIAALTKKGEKEISAAWDRVKKEAEELKASFAILIDEEHARISGKMQRGTEVLQARIVAGARRKIRKTATRLEDKMAAKLYETACAMLPEMHRTAGPDLFETLVRELPQCDWIRIDINPADADTAATLFPGCDIKPDSSLAGGLRAASRDEEIAVDNTLLKRLERAWPLILPHLLAEICQEAQQ